MTSQSAKIDKGADSLHCLVDQGVGIGKLPLVRLTCWKIPQNGLIFTEASAAPLWPCSAIGYTARTEPDPSYHSWRNLARNCDSVPRPVSMIDEPAIDNIGESEKAMLGHLNIPWLGKVSEQRCYPRSARTATSPLFWFRSHVSRIAWRQWKLETS